MTEFAKSASRSSTVIAIDVVSKSGGKSSGASIGLPDEESYVTHSKTYQS